MTERAWCYFGCLAQACYREARHIGQVGDGGAKCAIPPTDALAAVAAKCKSKRTVLEGVALWERARLARTTDEVLAPYVDATGLAPAMLPSLFRLPQWRPSYGGEPWACIAESLLKLKDAIDSDATDSAEDLCDMVQGLRHNKGPLVPTPEQWNADAWVRQKWPRLCP